jgi:hypothetical protein
MFSTDWMISWESLFYSALSCLNQSPCVLVHFVIWENLSGFLFLID